MNTSTLHRSSFGRIYLLTVEGFLSSLRPLLIFHAIMAVAFFGFPFLTLFLTRGFNIQEAFLELAGVYATGGVIGPYLIGTIIYILIWINKNVHTPSPGAYTQLPASAGEKMISIALLSLGYYLISLLSTLIISGIFGIFVPGGFSNVWNGHSLSDTFTGCSQVFNTLPLSSELYTCHYW